MISGEKQLEGHALATGTSGLMAIAMGRRFIQTGKFMPSGLVATVGAVSMVYHAKKIYTDRKIHA